MSNKWSLLSVIHERLSIPSCVSEEGNDSNYTLRYPPFAHWVTFQTLIFIHQSTSLSKRSWAVLKHLILANRHFLALENKLKKCACMDKMERRVSKTMSLAHSFQILYVLTRLKRLQDPESVKFNSKKVAFVLDTPHVGIQ